MRNRSARAASLAILAAVAIALTGCAGGDGADDATPSPVESVEATPSPSGSATSSPSASPSGDAPADEADDDAAPPFTANTEPDLSEPGGDGFYSVTEVRTGRHEGYDRVVFELAGTGDVTPGWRVEYVDQAIDEGSGSVVEIDGDTILSVIINRTAYPFDSGVEEYAGDPIHPDDTEVVAAVDYRFTFEGSSTAFIGIEGGQKPFRAFLLEDPTRVVVDVQH